MMIVIEGLDGCGKATQTKLLMGNLQKRNVEVQRITYPAYHSKSSTLVQMYLNGEIDKDAANINAYAASTFYAADRYIDFKREWQDAYLSDVTIISDRYTTANQLYQATKQPADSRIEFADWVGDFEYNKLGLPKPDFVILLRIPVEISQELMFTRYNGDISKKDIHETDTIYLKHIYDVSTEIAEHYGWHIIDCYQDNRLLSRKEIADMILAKYDAFINSIKAKTKG